MTKEVIVVLPRGCGKTQAANSEIMDRIRNATSDETFLIIKKEKYIYVTVRVESRIFIADGETK